MPRNCDKTQLPERGLTFDLKHSTVHALGASTVSNSVDIPVHNEWCKTLRTTWSHRWMRMSSIASEMGVVHQDIDLIDGKSRGIVTAGTTEDSTIAADGAAATPEDDPLLPLGGVRERLRGDRTGLPRGLAAALEEGDQPAIVLTISQHCGETVRHGGERQAKTSQPI
jgi:hypothetical protein